MHAKTQLKQFKRIQGHYQRELDTLSAELASLNTRVSKLRAEFEQLESRLQEAQSQPTNQATSIANCEARGEFLKHISAQWNDKFLEYSTASSDFEAQRSKVRQQMSRIESLENLILRKAETIASEEQQREQLASDERYLRRLVKANASI